MYDAKLRQMYFNLCFYGKILNILLPLHMIISVIILHKNGIFEAWGSLTDVCKAHKLSYSYLKNKRFPFIYKGITFDKVPYKMKNGI